MRMYQQRYKDRPLGTIVEKLTSGLRIEPQSPDSNSYALPTIPRRTRCGLRRYCCVLTLSHQVSVNF